MVLAVAAVEAARNQGVRLIFQAGSASWMRIRPEEDDGVMNTHFSYVYDPTDPISRRAIAAGLLIEIHAWAADPVSQRILDLTIPQIPAACERMGGMRWSAPRPTEDEVWVTGQDMRRKSWFYRPSLEAIRYALGQIQGSCSDPSKPG